MANVISKSNTEANARAKQHVQGVRAQAKAGSAGIETSEFYKNFSRLLGEISDQLLANGWEAAPPEHAQKAPSKPEAEKAANLTKESVDLAKSEDSIGSVVAGQEPVVAEPASSKSSAPKVEKDSEKEEATQDDNSELTTEDGVEADAAKSDEASQNVTDGAETQATTTESTEAVLASSQAAAATAVSTDVKEEQKSDDPAQEIVELDGSATAANTDSQLPDTSKQATVAAETVLNGEAQSADQSTTSSEAPTQNAEQSAVSNLTPDAAEAEPPQGRPVESKPTQVPPFEAKLQSAEDLLLRKSIQETLLTQLSAQAATAQSVSKITESALKNPLELVSPQSITKIDPALSKDNSAVRVAQEARSAVSVTKVAAARTIERVEAAIKEVARSHNGKTISVRLDPPDLGSVKVDMTIKDGTLSARVVTESQAATTLLRERSAEIKNALRSIGLNIDRINILLQGDEQPAANFSNFAQEFSHRPESESRKKQGNFAGSSAGAQERATNSGVLEKDDHWVA